MATVLDTNIKVDVRNLFTVRVVKFETKVDGAQKYVDITFELQADKTRSTLRVSTQFGRFPNTLIEPNSDAKMAATDSNGALKVFDVIKQQAWNVVRYTTEANKGPSGTHADVTWESIRQWALQETTKPSISQTLNTF